MEFMPKQSKKIGEYLIEISSETQISLTRYFDDVNDGYLAIAKSKNIDVSKLSHPSEIREILFGDNCNSSRLVAGEYEIRGDDDCRGGKDYKVAQKYKEPAEKLRHIADIYGVTDGVDVSNWDDLSFAKAIITFLNGKEDISSHSYRYRFINDYYGNKTPIFIGTSEELALNEMPNISADGDRYFNLYHATKETLDAICKSLTLAPPSGVLLDNIDKVPDVDSKNYVFALKMHDFIMAAIERKEYKCEYGIINFAKLCVGAKCTTKPYCILSEDTQHNYLTYQSK